MNDPLTQLLSGTHAYNNYGYSQLGQMQMNQNAAQLAQQQAVRYNQALLNAVQNQVGTKWMFNGKYVSVREMADLIWHESCAEKTHFILKYE